MQLSFVHQGDNRPSVISELYFVCKCFPTSEHRILLAGYWGRANFGLPITVLKSDIFTGNDTNFRLSEDSDTGQ